MLKQQNKGKLRLTAQVDQLTQDTYQTEVNLLIHEMFGISVLLIILTVSV